MYTLFSSLLFVEVPFKGRSFLNFPKMRRHLVLAINLYSLLLLWSHPLWKKALLKEMSTFHPTPGAHIGMEKGFPELQGKSHWNPKSKRFQFCFMFVVDLLLQGRCVPLTIAEARANPFNLLIALDELNSFEGSLFLDDGLSLDVGPVSTQVRYTVSPLGNGIQIGAKIEQNTFGVRPRLDSIDILGASSVSRVTVNGQQNTSFGFDDAQNILSISRS
eukprot:TRINITY_DN16711_c0_g1_i1.p1 TRINITY_DN16711_c0_g1~~TRINITY_DN16711_c0_g1_i1.p1  ORF type:complete len:218 (-),score=27.96 TRINITY_DN16711_c0_g1_i1:165-818(-)